jgi:hypothetical protein
MALVSAMWKLSESILVGGPLFVIIERSISMGTDTCNITTIFKLFDIFAGWLYLHAGMHCYHAGI